MCFDSLTGLDPAKPLIPNVLKSRLDAGDADQVQVLHTSSSYGDSKKIGHIDFYFNGGRIQPYCVNVTSKFNIFFTAFLGVNY